MYFFFNFLSVCQKKAKCANSNYFKTESDSTISFSKKREGRKTLNNFLFERRKSFATLLKMHQFESKAKVDHIINTFKGVWLPMAENDSYETFQNTKR